MQNTDVPLAFWESISNKYKKAGTSINPPPVEKNPLIIPAINPINDNFVYFHLAANEKDLSQGEWKDREQVKVETLDETLEVEMGTLSENNEENYYVVWKYKDAYYQLSGQIEKEELIKILNEMQYNA